MIPVLMYHTVGDGNGNDHAESVADPVYHLGRQQFVDHMNLIRERGIASTSIRDRISDEAVDGSGDHTGDTPASPMRESASESARQEVIIQFDDGAECHATTVTEVLLDAGHVGEFFVNPANAGRKGHAGWEMLRAMHSAGMSIQSHGHSHVYLDTLDDRELLDELVRSKKSIEDHVGAPVTVLAAPGGRINRRVAAMARMVGYRACCGSRPGYWRPASENTIIPRIPIRASTTLETLAGFLQADWQGITSMQLRYHVLRTAQQLLGNANYDRLRRQLLGAGSQPDGSGQAGKG